MRITERLLAFAVLTMLLLASCDFNFFGDGLFGPSKEYPVFYRSIAVEGFVLSATDSTAIEGASVRSLLPTQVGGWVVYVQNHIDQDSTGHYRVFYNVYEDDKDSKCVNGVAILKLEASAYSFVTQWITPTDSNHLECIDGIQIRNFYLQRISPQPPVFHLTTLVDCLSQ